MGATYDPFETEHVDYPHEPGRLWDCEACATVCHCTGQPGDLPCVACTELAWLEE